MKKFVGIWSLKICGKTELFGRNKMYNKKIYIFIINWYTCIFHFNLRVTFFIVTVVGSSQE